MYSSNTGFRPDDGVTRTGNTVKAQDSVFRLSYLIILQQTIILFNIISNALMIIYYINPSG